MSNRALARFAVDAVAIPLLAAGEVSEVGLLEWVLVDDASGGVIGRNASVRRPERWQKANRWCRNLAAHNCASPRRRATAAKLTVSEAKA
jgi:hypothetical protein